jgi:pimeloyl-ACP methyl ester carboxylesterase
MKNTFKRFAAGLIVAVILTAWLNIRASESAATTTCSSAETVVLLHGMARSSRSMNTMEKALKREGYQVVNVDYPSTTATIEKLTVQVFKTIEPHIENAGTVHFVTHSLGGIILRQHLQDHALPNLGRVVMLAPPSCGSEVPDKLGSTFLYKWINGPAGNQLGTGTDSFPLGLQAPEFELGIIAGDRSINPFLSMLIPGPDDGKVSLARVKPSRYTDYIQLHVTHACMMWNRAVIAQTGQFLKHGAFEHPEVCNERQDLCMDHSNDDYIIKSR